MLKEIDATVAPTIIIKPCDGEAARLAEDESSAGIISWFVLGEQARVEWNASRTDPAELPFRCKAQQRLIDPLEDSLNILISAAALGYLVMALLGL